MKASVEQLQTKYAFTERHACRLLLVSVSSFRYKPQQNDDSLRDRLVALARLSSSACVERKINLVHTQPGKPTQDEYVESFNGKLREECLRIGWFQNLFEGRIIANRRRDYNENRPCSSLNYLTPAEFARRQRRGEDVNQGAWKTIKSFSTLPRQRRLVNLLQICANNGDTSKARWLLSFEEQPAMRDAAQEHGFRFCSVEVPFRVMACIRLEPNC